MKRNTKLTLIVGLVIIAGAVTLWRAGAMTTIGAGYDLFNTPDNAQTGENFNLAAGFFENSAGSPSTAFSGRVALKGGAAVPGYNADTVIERTQAVNVPGSTPLLLTGLRLVSVGAMRVNFADGSFADYSVSVKESPSVPSGGSMHFNADGTFSSSLQINREYTFTSPGQPNRVFDSGTGDSQFVAWPAISLTATGTWESSGNETNAAIAPGGGVTIRPNTHQSIIAAHATTIAPRPTPTRKEIGPGIEKPNSGR
ncbi:MAG TPA: hypothetical protein VKA70_08615 [Blastocatellia bacterium]|nr:hypothetical protein [Blastocatellia bacterium]